MVEERETTNQCSFDLVPHFEENIEVLLVNNNKGGYN
jgi:hypothetical protein